ncbi:MAG TPA: hypothetical protein PKI89_09390 [Tepidiformaceae bacterium]|nr:hypothetical protein [Tepidiformaceae bacterium]
MTDRKPDCVYGLLVRDGRVFVRAMGGHFGLPGGVFRAMAEDRKVELRAHLWDQLGIEARSVWAQGAFDYRNPDEDREKFSGFYSVWEWDGDVPDDAGRWLSEGDIALTALPSSLRILLLSVLQTQAVRTR